MTEKAVYGQTLIRVMMKWWQNVIASWIGLRDRDILSDIWQKQYAIFSFFSFKYPEFRRIDEACINLTYYNH